MLRLGTILLLLCMVPAVAGAEDQLPALEELKADVNQLKKQTGGALAILGIAVSGYAFANWQDAKDTEGAPEVRHIAMMMGGIAAMVSGISIATH